MNRKVIEVPCKSNENKYTHRIIRYTLGKNDTIYENALKNAPILAKKLNDKDPSGKIRTTDIKETVAFSGYIAEAIVMSELNKKLLELNPAGNIIAHSVEFNKTNRDSFDQIDIKVTNTFTNNSKTIEVRSSNIFKVKEKDEEVYDIDQSLIGSYSTKNKLGEVKKDFYVTVFFRHSQEKLMYIKKNSYSFTTDIAGAASRENLEKLGVESNLKQNGANYLVINPISKSDSIDKICLEIYNLLK